jgi:16S rRNA (uracil1498-N3)-methyltransferase
VSERCYTPEAAQVGQTLWLDPEEAHHLIRVRRARVGQPLEVFDGQGLGFRAVLTNLSAKLAEVELLEALPPRRAPLRITLYVAPPKGDRLEWLVEKTTELGVERLVPLLTERTVVSPRETRLDRLRKRIIESAKQCGRFDLMAIDEPMPLDRLLAAPPQLGSFCFAAHPGGSHLAAIGHLAPGQAASILIGPEGGLSDAEIQQVNDAGWLPIGLGPIILRIETAAIAAVAGLLARVDYDHLPPDRSS